MFLTDREKALDSSIGRNVRGNMVVSVNQDVAVVLIKKAGCLNAAHQVICIDAAGIPILTFNGNNRNIVGSQFFGGNGMAEDNGGLQCCRPAVPGYSVVLPPPYCFR